MTLSLVLCLTAGKAAMVASRASSFYHSTLSSASQKKYSPHITDSSTPRPLCTWYTPPLRMPSHLASGLARCFSHSDLRIRTGDVGRILLLRGAGTGAVEEGTRFSR